MTRETLERAVAFPFIIFDLDGTLLDSMPFWASLGSEYLKSKNIEPPVNLRETIDALTLDEAATYFRETLGLELSNEEINRELCSLIDEAYRDKIPAKKDALDITLRAAENGAKMCVLTTSAFKPVDDALKRLGLAKYFDAVLTAAELKMNKRSGAIYAKTATLLDYDIKRTLVCEDALFAVRSAKEAGATVLAFYDEANKNDWDEICALADFTTRD